MERISNLPMDFLYLIPALVSAVQFVLQWQSDLLPRPAIVGVLCGTGLALQFVFDRSMNIWLAGLLINVAMALYLTIRMKLP